MPTVWAGRRRHLLVILFLLGIFQAIMALVMSFTVDSLLGMPAQVNAALNAGTAPDGSALDPAAVAEAGTYVPWLQLSVLAVTVLSIFGARWGERVVGEDLGQDYVYELRRKLIGTTLAGSGNPSLGVTITRASNDLTSVRNWVSQGMVPLLTSLPLIVVVLGVLAISNWQVGLAVGIPIVLLGLAVPPLAKATFTRARYLRRRRGRMSARIADTVRAGESIQAAGGINRELNALDRDSGKVVNAAVSRARITGLVRASAITAASLATAAVVVLGTLGMIDTAGVASAMTLVGVMSTPLGDLGRVVEYRQNYKAARRIQAPLLAQSEVLRKAEKDREENWKDVARERSEDGRNGLRIRRMVVQGQRVPLLQAGAGEVIQITSHDPGRIQPFLMNLLAGQNTAAEPGGQVPGLEMVVDGYDYTRAPGRQRRKLLGHASVRVPLERGTVSRAITYRNPQATDEQTREAFARVGLDRVLEAFPRGEDTRLKNGGQPLTGSQVARLKLGRALLGNPPLLVLDGIDADLDGEGLRLLRTELEAYPGVVLFTSQNPGRMAPGHRVWTVDAP
ncbi:ABC-type multidrug/protein/lipid transport system, ATPase [Citricoccus zhacaiensis]|uniref:ABC-type multidrug/protein/lipid transport system, ATPase n=1 Tax=Citricoccus zhacaiensis TaxID=489142 RepID=A0ABQ2LX67_9MICC|nr:ABC transporter ATP-binding protein [Citricoccus zhacaiensis]GGO44290.1 ABC-type multidrug/protein/lipid transport system, ATPase [Citricoccus zhacaiensis]